MVCLCPHESVDAQACFFHVDKSPGPSVGFHPHYIGIRVVKGAPDLVAWWIHLPIRVTSTLFAMMHSNALAHLLQLSGIGCLWPYHNNDQWGSQFASCHSLQLCRQPSSILSPLAVVMSETNRISLYFLARFSTYRSASFHCSQKMRCQWSKCLAPQVAAVV